MIEVIYDKEDTSVNDKAVLPKNIRQVGNPNGGKRIYIEDYVVTYLNYIARPGNNYARGAVLLGEYRQTDFGDIIFISGAVNAQNLELDMDESAFTEDAWAQIYDDIKEFFPDLSIMGWFLSRMGFSTAINEKIERMHVENFPGYEKVLYVSDSLEAEDAFYMYEGGQLVKQRGYYIYYSKNEAMQNYIIKQRGDINDNQNDDIERKDEELIKNFRKKTESLEPRRSSDSNLIYVAGSLGVLVLLAMGITIAGNNNKLQDMQISLNRLELTADDTEAVMSYDLQYEQTDATDVTTELETTQTTKEEHVTEVITIEETTEEVITEVTEETTIEESTTEETIPTIYDGENTYYIVRYGDTLTSIAYELFGSIEYTENIAKANNMDVDDKIYEGQKLLIPNIE